MIFGRPRLPEAEARLLSPRLLAHLGDAVFHLFEREREIISVSSVKDMHRKTTSRASAVSQAQLLDQIANALTEPEADIVRRARNVKGGSRRAGQNAYRRSTAFEALLGYLYLTDGERLCEILSHCEPDSSDAKAQAES
jgi:ribonuclease III family protein